MVQAGALNTLSPSVGPLTYDGRKQSYGGMVTIQNAGLASVCGPIQLLFTNLTPGVSVVGADGQIAGSYYMNIWSESLEPGESVKVRVRFTGTSNTGISFTPLVETVSPSAGHVGWENECH